jgi:predicted AAA+ superfamily ATPase
VRIGERKVLIGESSEHLARRDQFVFIKPLDPKGF